MTLQSWETILAIILLPKLVAPELSLFGVSFQIAKKVCNELEPQVNYVMKIEYWLSGLSGSKACVLILNLDSSQEGKGIWKIGCSNKASSDGKSRKVKMQQGYFQDQLAYAAPVIKTPAVAVAKAVAPVAKAAVAYDDHHHHH